MIINLAEFPVRLKDKELFITFSVVCIYICTTNFEAQDKCLQVRNILVYVYLQLTLKLYRYTEYEDPKRNQRHVSGVMWYARNYTQESEQVKGKVAGTKQEWSMNYDS